MRIYDFPILGHALCRNQPTQCPGAKYIGKSTNATLKTAMRIQVVHLHVHAMIPVIMNAGKSTLAYHSPHTSLSEQWHGYAEEEVERVALWRIEGQCTGK
jgi:hypothetical protein